METEATLSTAGTGPDKLYTGESQNATGPDTLWAAGLRGRRNLRSPACRSTLITPGGGIDPKTGQVIGGGNDFVYGSQGIDIVSGHSSSSPVQTDQTSVGRQRRPERRVRDRQDLRRPGRRLRDRRTV